MAGISPGELPEPPCTPAFSSRLMGLQAEPTADGIRNAGHIPKTVTTLGRADPALHGSPHLCKSGCGSQLQNQGKATQQEHFGTAPALLATPVKVMTYTSNQSRTQNTSGEEKSFVRAKRGKSHKFYYATRVELLVIQLLEVTSSLHCTLDVLICQRLY